VAIIGEFEQPGPKVQASEIIWTNIDEEAESLGTEIQTTYQERADSNQPIPNMKRVSIDIEVESEGRMPNPREHDRRIIAVDFARWI
jgi:DNA polymerase I